MIVSDDTFQLTLESHNLVLIDFWAEWCGPCKKISPILDEIAQERGLWVGKLNVDENPKITTQYGINSIPTMVLFKSGQPVKTIVGAKPKHVMLEELSEWI
jgi:thioredoxin 1